MCRSFFCEDAGSRLEKRCCEGTIAADALATTFSNPDKTLLPVSAKVVRRILKHENSQQIPQWAISVFGDDGSIITFAKRNAACSNSRPERPPGLKYQARIGMK